MELTEIGKLLRLVAATDGRTPPDRTVAVLLETILPGGMTYDDAEAALIEHRRDQPGVFLEPGHLIVGVRRIQRQRLAAAGEPPIPGSLVRSEEQRWRRFWLDAVKAGEPSAVAAGMASRAMGLEPEDVAPAEVRKAAMKELTESLASRFVMPPLSEQNRMAIDRG